MARRLFHRLSPILTVFLALGIAAAPMAADDAFAKRSGSLTSEQRKDFKERKTNLMKARTAALKTLKQQQPAYDKAKRAFQQANSAAIASRSDLNTKQANLDAQITFERTEARRAGVPFTQSVIAREMRAALDQAEKRHQAGAKARFEAANAQFGPIKTQYDRDMRSLREASDGLVTRKADKNSARAENLKAATDRKAANKRGRQGTITQDVSTLSTIPLAGIPTPTTLTRQIPGQQQQAQQPQAQQPQAAASPVARPQVMFKIPPPPFSQAAGIQNSGVNRPLPPRPANEPQYVTVPPLASRAIRNQYDAPDSPLN